MLWMFKPVGRGREEYFDRSFWKTALLRLLQSLVSLRSSCCSTTITILHSTYWFITAADSVLYVYKKLLKLILISPIFACLLASSWFSGRDGEIFSFAAAISRYYIYILWMRTICNLQKHDSICNSIALQRLTICNLLLWIFFLSICYWSSGFTVYNTILPYYLHSNNLFWCWLLDFCSVFNTYVLYLSNYK
jgi:hypothetical protein